MGIWEHTIYYLYVAFNRWVYAYSVCDARGAGRSDMSPAGLNLPENIFPFNPVNSLHLSSCLDWFGFYGCRPTFPKNAVAVWECAASLLAGVHEHPPGRFSSPALPPVWPRRRWQRVKAAWRKTLSASSESLQHTRPSWRPVLSRMPGRWIVDVTGDVWPRLIARYLWRTLTGA